MKKIILFTSFLTLAATAWSQKLTLKKDEFRLDGDPVATIEEKRSENIVNKNFTISNIAGQPLVIMKVHTLWNPLSFNHPMWYEVTFVPLNKVVTREIPDGIFGIRKALLEEFADLNIFKKDGLNEEGVNQYAQHHSEDLAARGKVMVDSLTDLIKKSSYIKTREHGRLRVSSDHTIREKDVQIGTWEKYGDRIIVRNDVGGIEGVITRTKGSSGPGGSSDEVDIVMFLNGERHNYSTSDTGIAMNDSDTGAVEKFVHYAISHNNM